MIDAQHWDEAMGVTDIRDLPCEGGVHGTPNHIPFASKTLAGTPTIRCKYCGYTELEILERQAPVDG